MVLKLSALMFNTFDFLTLTLLELIFFKKRCIIFSDHFNRNLKVLNLFGLFLKIPGVFLQFELLSLSICVYERNYSFKPSPLPKMGFFSTQIMPFR